MTKKEIYDKIVSISAEVCNVGAEDIVNGCRKEDVVTARSIATFWCLAAGLSVESLLSCTNKSSHQSIDSIKARFEEYWVERFAYHVLIKEVGKRLHQYAHTIGEDFDLHKPVERMRKRTGKY